MGIAVKKKLLHVNNKGADQAEHLHSLISTFVICFLNSLIAKHATSKNSIFQLVSVAQQAEISLT